ncbi:MAG: hypothetical protein HeimC3_37130 [Candidatus Heimdallarchaeota archaeon LC_3]|nr:MAG: hypothetical protein HeimC3_37130 [Candidatus Heimdallarchaeota archaeon LC_3]
MTKRVIEWNMPINFISANASKEAKKGHISTLHTWWARRPLAISRSTIFASLIDLPNNTDKQNEINSIIKNLSKSDKRLHLEAFEIFSDTWKLEKPKILDPFSGGGSIPFEANKLGCKTFANDLNPVAVIILKALLEWPAKCQSLKFLDKNNAKCSNQKDLLIKLILKYADIIEKKSFQEINKFYQYRQLEGKNPLAYYWIKYFKCPNHLCNTEIPLLRNFYLSNKPNKKVVIKPIFAHKKVSFDIVAGDKIDFDASQGTISRGKFNCIICNQVFSSNELRKASFKKGLKEKLVAIIIQTTSGKKYFKPTQEDITTFNSAQSFFNEKIKTWPYEIDPIPTENIRTPTGRPLNTISDPFYVHLQIVNYGINTWGDLFNNRQKLALLTFLQNFKSISNDILTECENLGLLNAEELTTITLGYLSIIFNRFMSYNNNLNRWVLGGESIANCFSRTGLAMVYDYPEVNPFADSFGWKTQVTWIIEILKRNNWDNETQPLVSNYSATELPFKDNFFDAVITDPPYYDNVPYADLSDFFYVLFKRTIGNKFPELFSTPLTPKLDECIANEKLLRRKSSINSSDYKKLGIKDKNGFNNLLTKSFKEIFRILKPTGIAIIVYAHKTNEGWETMIDSLNRSGLVVTASWPFHTEMKNRLQARSSAALASSIYMICRKRLRKDIGFFSELSILAREKIFEKLNFFWDEEVNGGDLFISSIGPALEIFLQYKHIENYNGEKISSKQLLQFIRQSCTNYVLGKLLKNTSVEMIDKPSLFYLLYRWMFLNHDIEYEEARKIALSTGLNLEEYWNKRGSFIIKKGSRIRMLDSNDRIEHYETDHLIDAIHKSIKHWENNQFDEIKLIIDKFTNLQEEFWLLCQALIETLEPKMSEKKLLEGFLLSKKKILEY